MRHITKLALLLVLTLVSTSALANRHYTRQNGAKFQRAVSAATRAVNAAQSVQNSITAERNRYNAGMASTQPATRRAAKQRFIGYLDRLWASLGEARTALDNAAHWGERYSRSLIEVRHTAATGRQVAAQARAYRTQSASLLATQRSISTERNTAYWAN